MCAACLCHRRASSAHFARTCRQTSRTRTHREQNSRSPSSSFNSRSYELFVNPINLYSPYLGNKAARLLGLSVASSSHVLSFIDRRLTVFLRALEDPGFDHIQDLVFTCTHRKMDTHSPAYMINIGVLVSNYGNLFAQVPGMFVFCSTSRSIFSL